MSGSVTRLRGLAVVASAFVLAVVAAGSVLAGSNPPVVYACISATGQVAMSTVPQCKLAGGGQLVSINTVGSTGPAGPMGPTGPNGSTGPTGPAGPAGTGSSITRMVVQDFDDTFHVLDTVNDIRIALRCGETHTWVRIDNLGTEEVWWVGLRESLLNFTDHYTDKVWDIVVPNGSNHFEPGEYLDLHAARYDGTPGRNVTIAYLGATKRLDGTTTCRWMVTE